jgi:hypothetical protein
MTLDDPFQVFRRAVVIPGALRVDNGDRPLFANLQAARFGAVDAGLGFGEAQVSEAAFEEIPAGHGVGRGGTLGFFLFGTEEDMTSNVADAELSGNGLQLIEVGSGNRRLCF